MSSYEERSEEALKPLAKEMRILGFWPAAVFESKNHLRRLLLNCYIWFNLMYYIVNLIAVFFACVADKEDMANFVDAISMFGGGSLILSKSIIIVVQREALHTLIKELVCVDFGENMDIIRFLRRDNLDNKMMELKDAVLASREASFGEFQRFYFGYLKICSMAIFQFTFYPMILTIYEYYTNPEQFNRYLPYKMALPFDINVTPGYQIIYVAQCYDSVICFIGWNGTDMTFVVMMIMMIRQLTLIRILLKDLDKYAIAIYDHRQFEAIGLKSNDDSVTLEDVYYRILSQCNDHYARLINLRDNIAAALGPMLLSQMFISTMIMCFTLFITTSADTARIDKTLTNIIYFILTTVQIFLYSYYGQKMANEAAEIGKDAYQVKWEDRTKAFGDALRMLIREASRPLYLNALGFVDLTLPTFQTIFRTAMSYFTLLRSFSEEE